MHLRPQREEALANAHVVAGEIEALEAQVTTEEEAAAARAAGEALAVSLEGILAGFAAGAAGEALATEIAGLFAP